MTNNLIKDTTKTISSVISPEIVEQYGWIALLAPVAIYTIDKVSDLITKAMDKGYSIDINTEKVQVSLNKTDVIAE